MSVVLANGVMIAGEIEDVPLRYPRICIKRIDGTVSASTEADDFPATRANTPMTYGGWKPTSVPATWEIDPGISESVNYCGIGGHNLATQSASAQPQYWDGSAWQDAAPEQIPATNEPLIFLFDTTSASKWRVRVTGAAATIAVIKFGMATAVERGMKSGWEPARWNRENEYTNQISEGGQILGRTVKRTGIEQDIRLEDIDESWADNNWDTLRPLFETEGVFFAWDPENHPNHVAYGMTEREPTLRYSRLGGFVTLRIRLRGVI